MLTCRAAPKLCIKALPLGSHRNHPRHLINSIPCRYRRCVKRMAFISADLTTEPTGTDAVSAECTAANCDVSPLSKPWSERSSNDRDTSLGSSITLVSVRDTMSRNAAAGSSAQARVPCLYSTSARNQPLTGICYRLSSGASCQPCTKRVSAN